MRTPAVVHRDMQLSGLRVASPPARAEGNPHLSTVLGRKLDVMPPRELREAKISIPKWMWGLAIPVIGWGGHQSVQLTRVAATQELMHEDISSLKEQVWELNGRRNAHASMFTDPPWARCSKPLPFPAGLSHVAAELIDETSKPPCEDP